MLSLYDLLPLAVGNPILAVEIDLRGKGVHRLIAGCIAMPQQQKRKKKHAYGAYRLQVVVLDGDFVFAFGHIVTSEKRIVIGDTQEHNPL